MALLAVMERKILNLGLLLLGSTVIHSLIKGKRWSSLPPFPARTTAAWAALDTHEWFNREMAGKNALADIPPAEISKEFVNAAPSNSLAFSTSIFVISARVFAMGRKEASAGEPFCDGEKRGKCVCPIFCPLRHSQHLSNPSVEDEGSLSISERAFLPVDSFRRRRRRLLPAGDGLALAGVHAGGEEARP